MQNATIVHNLTRLGVICACLFIGLLAVAQQSTTQPSTAPSVEGSVNNILMQERDSAKPDGSADQKSGPKVPKAQNAEQARTGNTVTAIQSEKRQVTIGGQGIFEPILQKKLPETELPDDGDVVSLNAKDAAVSVIEVLDLIANATGWNVVASKELEQQTVRFWVKDVKPRQIMEILKYNHIHYEFDPQTKFLYVMLDGEYLERQYGATKNEDFLIKNADVQDMEAVLNGLMSQTGRLISDPRTGHILVWDTESNLEAMRSAVKQLDVPLKPRVFTLKHVSADSLLETIQSLLSERGLAQADPRANSIVVTDLPARQEQIATMLEALDQPLVTKTWTLRYIEPKAISEQLENIIPEEAGVISVNKDTHQISLTAIQTRIDDVDKIIKEWDVKGKQVQIEAFLVSASTNVIRNLSIDWSYFDEIAGVPFAIQSGSATPDYTSAPGSGQRTSVGRLPYRAFLRDDHGVPVQEVSNKDGSEAGNLTGNYILDPNFKGNRVAVVLDYLDSTGDVNILARPRVTVQDGQEASFENTTEKPFQSVGYSGYGSTVVDSNASNDLSSRVIPGQVQFIKVGTVLKVKPRINEESNILMEIETEDSSAEDKTILAAGLASTVPQKTQNKAETKVLVKDGQTIVIGGLRAVSVKDDVERVPLLGELPFVGRLFKNTKKDHLDRELAVFITPTVVDEFTQPEAERAAAFDEQATDTVRHSEKSVWGRAQDRIADGKNEVTVSVGQSGAIQSEGKVISEAELGDKLKTYSDAKIKPVIILRVHPNAPAAVSERINELAQEAGLKVKTEDERTPFVPTPRGETLKKKPSAAKATDASPEKKDKGKK